MTPNTPSGTSGAGSSSSMADLLPLDFDQSDLPEDFLEKCNYFYECVKSNLSVIVEIFVYKSV